MFPSWVQYNRWSLPNKWAFCANVIGISVGIISLLITSVISHVQQETLNEERARRLLRVAQELRYNDEWLASVAVALETGSSIPSGSMKLQGLVSIAESDHKIVVENAYGEEKYIYQLVLRLNDLGVKFGSPKTRRDVSAFNGGSDYTLHDIHFLNNFVLWYLVPVISEHLDEQELYSLGWRGLPGDSFDIANAGRIEMKHFRNDGKPITSFGEHLGLID